MNQILRVLRIVTQNRILYLNPLTTQQLPQVLLHHSHTCLVLIKISHQILQNNLRQQRVHPPEHAVDETALYLVVPEDAVVVLGVGVFEEVGDAFGDLAVVEGLEELEVGVDDVVLCEDAGHAHL